MTPARLQLAGWILRLYAARQVAKGCDGLGHLPHQRLPLVHGEPVGPVEANSKDPDEYARHIQTYATGSTCPPAWWLAAFFADRMGAPDVEAEW